MTSKKRVSGNHLKRDDLERLIEERTSELRTHQIELEMQNEELRAAQLELEASRVKYADLYEFAPVAYFTFDAKGLIQEANVTAAKQLGISKKLLLNKPFALFIHGSDGRLVFAAHRKETCLTQERHTCEIRLRRVDGTFFYAQLESIAVDNIDVKAGHIRTAATDITERKWADEVLRKAKDELERHVQLRTSELAETISALTSEIVDRKRAEKELSESRENLKKAQAIAHIGSWSFDLRSRQVIWSRELFRIFGIAPGTIDSDLKDRISRIVHSGDRQKVRQAYRQMIKTSKAQPFECRVSLPDGKKRIVWAEAEMVRDSLEQPVSIVGTVQDITDRKRAEEELIRLATALESAADAVVITDSVRGVIQYVNPAFEKITGYARDEALGRDLHMLDSGRHDEAFYEQLRYTLREEGFWSGRLVQKRKDGTLYEEECTYSPVRNASGEIINYISIKRDVTEKVRLESIAQAVDTMKNIGYIFAGVSHEIGTPINTIGMNLDMISKKLDTLTKENIAEYVDRAQTSGVEGPVPVAQSEKLQHVRKPAVVSDRRAVLSGGFPVHGKRGFREKRNQHRGRARARREVRACRPARAPAGAAEYSYQCLRCTRRAR